MFHAEKKKKEADNGALVQAVQLSARTLASPAGGHAGWELEGRGIRAPGTPSGDRAAG